MGDFKAAERWLRRAIRSSHETRPKIFNDLGITLTAQNKMEDAKRAHRQSVAGWRKAEKTKEEAIPYYNLALIYRSEGKYKQALSYASSAVDLNPKDEDTKQVRRDLLNTIAYLRASKRPKRSRR
jgi:tetratricopeptide (TPR) repeat protein